MQARIAPQQMRRVLRSIEVNGNDCTFTRKKLNDFNEHTGDTEIVHACKCLFHASSVFLKIKLVDSGKIQTEKQPMLLMEYTDKIQIGDNVEINGVSYSVSGFTNIHNSNQLLDVSLGGGAYD